MTPSLSPRRLSYIKATPLIVMSQVCAYQAFMTRSLRSACVSQQSIPLNSTRSAWPQRGPGPPLAEMPRCRAQRPINRQNKTQKWQDPGTGAVIPMQSLNRLPTRVHLLTIDTRLPAVPHECSPAQSRYEASPSFHGKNFQARHACGRWTSIIPSPRYFVNVAMPVSNRVRFWRDKQ